MVKIEEFSEIKYNKLAMNSSAFEDKLTKIADYLSAEFPQVAAVYLFGSQAEGAVHAASDIDLALLLYPGAKLSFLQMAEYQAKVSKLLGTDRVDIVSLEKVSRHIQFAVLNRGHQVFCKDPQVVAEFIEEFSRYYPDWHRYYETSYRLYRDFLKQQYGVRQRGEDMLDMNRITEKINYIRQTCLPILSTLASKPLNEFVQDRIATGAARYYLQTALEAVLDINNHILSRQGLGTFETHARTLEILANAGVLSKANLPIYIPMVGLRNRLVHMYDQVDDSVIHQILNDHLSGFETYIAEIIAFMDLQSHG